MARKRPKHSPFRALADRQPVSQQAPKRFSEVAERDGIAKLSSRASRIPPPAAPSRPAAPPNSPLEVRDEDGWLEGWRADVEKRHLALLRGLPDASLDLHGLHETEARREVFRFIAAQRRRGRRLVLVICGKGRRSAGGYGVLRASIGDWLAELGQHVTAFRTATPELGGDGAVLVVLAEVRR